MPGLLYGVGVGPGDPDLITVKAVGVIRKVGVIFAAASANQGPSRAHEIITPHLDNGADLRRLEFPMKADPEVLEQAWQTNAEKVWQVLAEGRDAAFLTLGDPMTYSTFIYLHRTLLQSHPDLRTEVIPGVTSYAAAAAAAQVPLAEGEETLCIVSGAQGGRRLEDHARKVENVVVMKAYKHFDSIRQSLDRLGLKDKAVLVSRVGFEDQSVVRDVDAVIDRPPYFSLVIAKNDQGADNDQ